MGKQWVKQAKISGHKLARLLMFYFIFNADCFKLVEKKPSDVLSNPDYDKTKWLMAAWSNYK